MLRVIRTSALPSAAVYSTGSSGRIGQRNWLDYDWLNKVCGVPKGVSKTRRFIGGDAIPLLNSGIKKNTLDLVENEPRENQGMAAQNEVEKPQGRAAGTCDGSNENIGIESKSQLRRPRTVANASPSRSSIS
jgi:hypothetical protein